MLTRKPRYRTPPGRARFSSSSDIASNSRAPLRAMTVRRLSASVYPRCCLPIGELNARAVVAALRALPGTSRRFLPTGGVHPGARPLYSCVPNHARLKPRLTEHLGLALRALWRPFACAAPSSNETRSAVDQSNSANVGEPILFGLIIIASRLVAILQGPKAATIPVGLRRLPSSEPVLARALAGLRAAC
jgi:hypothetical protein